MLTETKYPTGKVFYLLDKKCMILGSHSRSTRITHYGEPPRERQYKCGYWLDNGRWTELVLDESTIDALIGEQKPRVKHAERVAITLLLALANRVSAMFGDADDIEEKFATVNVNAAIMKDIEKILSDIVSVSCAPCEDRDPSRVVDVLHRFIIKEEVNGYLDQVKDESKKRKTKKRRAPYDGLSDDEEETEDSYKPKGSVADV